MTRSRNKVVLGLAAIALTLVFSLGLLFYTLSGHSFNTSLNNSNAKQEYSNSAIEADNSSKEAPRFNIFSILNRFISN